jgi:MFS family permease
MSRSNSTMVITSSWQLLLGMGILMLGAGLQSTEISLRATLEGFTPTVTGIVMSCYYLGYLAGTSAAPYLVRRVGHIRVFAAMAAIASATILLQAIFVQPLSWALLRGISGLCFAAIYVVAESWLNDRSSRATRGTLLAIYMVVLYIGLGGAQFLLIPADPRTTTPFMLAAVMISLAMVPIVLAAHRAPEIALPRKVSYRELYRDSPLGVVGVTVAGMVTSSVYSMGPVYAQRSGLATTGVATFMGVSILAAVIGQYPIGRLSDRVDRRTIMAWVCSLASASAVLLVVFMRMPRLIFFPLTALFSSMAFTLYSLSVSHVNDQLEPQQMVAASGALLRLNGLGAAVSPVLLGALIGQFGPPAYFGTLAALTLGLTIFDLWRKRRSEPVPADLKGTFISAGPQGAATQIAAGSLTPQPAEPAGAPHGESRSSRGAPAPGSPS